MKIDNKFNIKDEVTFGPHKAKVVQIVVDSDGLVYKVAFFDKDDNYRVVDVFDFEITKTKDKKESQIGF